MFALKLSHFSQAEIKESVLTEPDTRKLIPDAELVGAINDLEREAWVSFKKVISKSLDKNKNQITKKGVPLQYKSQIHFSDLHLEFLHKEPVYEGNGKLVPEMLEYGY